MDVLFLYNHDQPHQVAHSLPIALELARRPGVTVAIATSGPVLEPEVMRIGGARLDGIAHIRLDAASAAGLASTLRRRAISLADRLIPAGRVARLADHAATIARFDVLVVTEKTSLMLRDRLGDACPAIVHTGHGAGDRAIGFSHHSRDFDLILAPGDKTRRRLIDIGVDPLRIVVTGSAKLELYTCLDAPAPSVVPGFANPARPTVLYAPHPSPHLSSWFRLGVAALDALLAADRHNVIFAPHVMLFSRKVQLTVDRVSAARVRPLPPRFRRHPALWIDLGGPGSTDMSYVRQADVFVGDVSSQVYEYLATPRPVLFLDAHATRWAGDPNFAVWQAGPVIDDPARLPDAVDAAIATHDRWRPVQDALVADTYDRAPPGAAARGADAIIARFGHHRG